MGRTVGGSMAGKTVLVTGASGGIGKATALGLAALGAGLAITDRDRDRAEDAAQEIRSVCDGQVDVFIADLSSQAEVRRLAEEVLAGLNLTGNERKAIQQALEGLVRKRAGGDGAAALTNPINIGVGVK